LATGKQAQSQPNLSFTEYVEAQQRHPAMPMAKKFQDEFESLLQYERLLYEYDLKRHENVKIERYKDLFPNDTTKTMKPGWMQSSHPYDGSFDSFQEEPRNKHHYTTHANLPLACADLFTPPHDAIHQRYNVASNP